MLCHEQQGLEGRALCLQGQGGQCGDIGDRSVDVQALRHHAVAQVTVGHQAEQMSLLHQQYGRDAQVAHLLCRGADGGLGCQGDGLALDECAYRGAQQVQVHPRVGRRGGTGLPRRWKRGKKISQCAMLAAQRGDGLRVQPGNAAIGCGGGLPGGPPCPGRGRADPPYLPESVRCGCAAGPGAAEGCLHRLASAPTGAPARPGWPGRAGSRHDAGSVPAGRWPGSSVLGSWQCSTSGDEDPHCCSSGQVQGRGLIPFPVLPVSSYPGTTRTAGSAWGSMASCSRPPVWMGSAGRCNSSRTKLGCASSPWCVAPL